MMHTETKAPAAATPAQDAITIGTLTFTFAPHYIEGLGARMLVTINSIEPAARARILSITSDDARTIADHLKLNACKAEALERRAKRHRENAWD